MTDTPPDWVLIEAAKRGGWHWWSDCSIKHLQTEYINGDQDDMFRALCDMILKHEQPPVDRKLLCAREAVSEWDDSLLLPPIDVAIRAIKLWEEGFGK